jgi:uncharacterized membrane protein
VGVRSGINCDKKQYEGYEEYFVLWQLLLSINISKYATSVRNRKESIDLVYDTGAMLTWMLRGEIDKHLTRKNYEN